MPVPSPDDAFDFRHCTLDKLDIILPIGFSAELGDNFSFSLHSLECYRDGFVAIVVTEVPFTQPDPDGGQDSWEQPAILRAMPYLDEIEDDAGNRYRGRWRAGSGGGGDGRLQSRWVFCVRPALAKPASQLSLTLRYVENLRYEAGGDARWTANQDLPGPWRIEVPLINHLEGAPQ